MSAGNTGTILLVQVLRLLAHSAISYRLHTGCSHFLCSGQPKDFAGPLLARAAGTMQYTLNRQYIPVAPVAYQVILEPVIGQFREFEPRSAYSYKFVGTFSCGQIDLRKARERELAAPMKNQRAVGLLSPMRDKN